MQSASTRKITYGVLGLSLNLPLLMGAASGSAAILVAGQATWAPSALAASSVTQSVTVTNPCPGTDGGTHDWRQQEWDSTTIAGMRAAIQLRKDGSLCSASPNDGFSLAYVDVQGEPTAISQIGFAHVRSWGSCRFWEWNNNQTDTTAVPYDCGQDSGGLVNYFKVHEVQDPNSGAYHYAVADCGPSWANCHQESEGPAVSSFNVDSAVLSEEADYAGACANYDMGSLGSPTAFSVAEGMPTRTSSWATQTLHNGSTSVCSHYKIKSADNRSLQVYDDRN